MTRTRPPTEPSPPGSPLLEPPSAHDVFELEQAMEEEQARTTAQHRAFTEIVRRNRRKLYAYARKCLQAADEVDDLVQDVFFAAWKCDVIAQCGGDDRRIGYYLLLSMRNAVVNEFRRRHRLRELLARYAASLATKINDSMPPLQYSVCRDIEWYVDRALQKLPPDCRDAFLMVRLLGMSHADAAETLQMNVNTLHVNLTRAQWLLRQSLAAVGYCPGPEAEGGEKEHTP